MRGGWQDSIAPAVSFSLFDQSRGVPGPVAKRKAPRAHVGRDFGAKVSGT